MINKTIKVCLTAFTLGISALHAQVKTMTVADSADSSLLPYVTVKVINKNSGCYSDAKGLLTIQADDNDSLLLSCTGYENAVIPLYKTVDTIFLVKKIFELPEVTVMPLVKEIIAGYFKYRSFFTYFFGESSESATAIDLSGVSGSYRINKIFLPVDINHKTFNNSVCKVHIYKQDERGYPGDELLRTPVFIDKTFGAKNNFYIDVSDQGIVCSEKVLFVAVECVMEQITAAYKPGLSSRRDFNQQARTSPLSLYIAREAAFFNGTYDHHFFRSLYDKNYKWSGGRDSSNKKVMNIAAGLVLLPVN